MIAMSLLNGAHLTLFPKVSRLLREQNVDYILLVGGGVIPESDKSELEKAGITGNFLNQAHPSIKLLNISKRM